MKLADSRVIVDKTVQLPQCDAVGAAGLIFKSPVLLLTALALPAIVIHILPKLLQLLIIFGRLGRDVIRGLEGAAKVATAARVQLRGVSNGRCCNLFAIADAAAASSTAAAAATAATTTATENKIDDSINVIESTASVSHQQY